MHAHMMRIVRYNDHLMALSDQLGSKAVSKALDAAHAGKAQGGKNSNR